MKKVLMVAFNFPPCHGSSGLLRTLKLCRYLPQHGWQPIVLTAMPRAYTQRSDSLLAEIPPTVRVERSFALDVSRHFAIAGRYPGFLATPDRYWPWLLGAVPDGLKLIKEEKPDLLWSTSPVITAQMIGLALARHSGLPWVMDLRDPMYEPGNYPASRSARAISRFTEGHGARTARRIVVTTQGLQQVLQLRYPQAEVEVIANGYDEENFQEAESIRPGSAHATAADNAELTILHSGLIDESRNPIPMLQALAAMKTAGEISAGDITVRLRAPGDEQKIRSLAERFNLSDIVHTAPPLPYKDALREMLDASALLILQGNNYNNQVPAKVYEYFRAGKPILGLTDSKGETSTLLKDSRGALVANLENAAEIRIALETLITQLRTGNTDIASPEWASQFSRKNLSAKAAALFDRIIDNGDKG